ncbi:exopolysaccharide production repressor protein [Mesorhizobium silamurunense]|jgi:fatty acid desaturase|uniref:exopolysaccharide production repressor protein n=1 Tax=Mesorhizobium silamurunense TaxID=499528 RepID=UPI001782C070|nr:exopolysaccharide production repressor protein [Mesorhizobium silamurunense]
MYFPQFLVGMLMASSVVGTWAYAATGSIWMSIAWTLIAAVLLQVGYLGFVFRLLYGQRHSEQKAEATNPDATKQQAVPRQPRHNDGR